MPREFDRNSKPPEQRSDASNILSSSTFIRTLGELTRYTREGRKITASESVRHDEALKKKKKGIKEETIVGNKREIIITDGNSGITKDISTEIFVDETALAARKMNDGSYPLGRVSAHLWDGSSQNARHIASFGLQFTDSGKVTYSIDGKKGPDEVINQTVEKEVREWGVPIELKDKASHRSGLLDEGGGYKFIAALRNLNLESKLQLPSETEK